MRLHEFDRDVVVRILVDAESVIPENLPEVSPIHMPLGDTKALVFASLLQNLPNISLLTQILETIQIKPQLEQSDYPVTIFRDGEIYPTIYMDFEGDAFDLLLLAHEHGRAGAAVLAIGEHRKIDAIPAGRCCPQSAAHHDRHICIRANI